MTKDSRTQEALRLMRDEGITAYAAAKRVSPPLTTTTVHNAWRKSQGICPCCGVRLGVVEWLKNSITLAENSDDKAIYREVLDYMKSIDTAK